MKSHLDFSCEDGLCLRRGVDAVCLDGDDEVSSVLEEVGGVDGHDTGLVGLGHVGEDRVNHGYQHPVTFVKEVIQSNTQKSS